jgi:uncharacterized protein (TIGR02145 family)
MLDVKSTTKGFSLPRMTHTEMLAISSPAEGLMIFNITYNKVAFFSGTIWIIVDGPPCSPDTPGAISGSQFVYPNTSGEIYSIAAVPDATSYVWSVPPDASITSGQGTTSIEVSFGTTSGNVSVYASNICGSGAATYLYVTVFTCGDVLTDTRDGSTYNTVSINGQCWFGENLNIGSMISGTSTQTDNGTIEKYCFDNSSSNCDTYGGLYQWDEMMQYGTTEGIQGVCPDGWHIPTDAEWTTLTNYAGGLSVAGGKLKEIGTTHWLTPNTGATNQYDFTSLPAGYHNNDGNFNFQTSISYSWSSTQTGTSVYGRRMHFQSAEVNHWTFNKQWGFSVRCIRD